MNKAVFLDRDGVINNDVGHYYIYKPEDVLLNAGVIEQEFLSRVANNTQLKNLVIVASGIHTLDASGANMLKRFGQEMESANVTLYLSDVKVPLANKLNDYGVFAGKPERLNQATIELFKQLS